MTSNFDVVVIGAGPAGYVAAIRCAQLGMNTACVDEWINDEGKPSLGGTCLNVGCIPSKALLDTTKHYHQLTHQYSQHGIKADNVSIDVNTMIARKNKIVKQLTGGIGMLFKANKVTSFSGRGTLTANNQVTITPSSGDTEVITANNIIIATGSVPIEIPSVAFDGKYIIDNAGALNLNDIPKRLGVIGAGVIGLELGSVWKRLGADVTLLEAYDQFLAAADPDIAKVAQREFKKQGLAIKLGAKVEKASVKNNQVIVEYSDSKGKQTTEFDKLLVAVGRKPNTDNLIGKGVDLRLDDRGRIDVDDYCRTNLANVYAIGDVVRGPMLAHKGSEEGIFVAEVIAGQKPHLDFNTVPWVIYTEPEIAWVGKTETQLKADNINFRSGSFPFAATGRALAMNEPTGQVKILADAETDKILGVHILGANASELITEAVVAMEFAASSEDLARIIHAHPTLSEAVHEAALAVDKRAIHKTN